MSPLLIGCGSEQPEEDRVFFATWEVGKGKLAPDAQIKYAEGLEFYVNGQPVSYDDIPKDEWFIVIKRGDADFGKMIISSPSHNVTTIKIAKPGTGKCPQWAIEFLGDNCMSDELPISKK